MPRENRIQRATRERLKRLDPHILVRVGWGSAYAITGDPDIYGVVKGRAFALELKQPGEKPREVQKYRLAEWEKAGAIVGVAHSADEAADILVRGLLEGYKEGRN